jgi:uncharacterized protein YndB with AHSA1/START domain
MKAIRVERTIDAPIEAVFDVLADHANYDRFRGIRRSELVRPGEKDRNGVGALRRVAIGPLVFEEEITAYERPTRLDYLIVKLNFPFRHKGGSIRLEPADSDGTNAVWTSAFEIPVPLAGWALERAFGFSLDRGFAGTLEDSGRVATRAVEPARDLARLGG